MELNNLTQENVLNLVYYSLKVNSLILIFKDYFK